MVPVDEPQLHVVGRAGPVDVRDEARPVAVIGEVAEVADLDDDRAVTSGSDTCQVLDHLVFPWVSPAMRTRRTSSRQEHR